MGTWRWGHSWMSPTEKPHIPRVVRWTVGIHRAGEWSRAGSWFQQGCGSSLDLAPLDLVTQVERWILQRGHTLHPWGLEHGGGKACASAEPERTPTGEGDRDGPGREGGREAVTCLQGSGEGEQP